MKTYTLRFRLINKLTFDQIKRGLKLVETRAATVKYQPIEKGDFLIFVCGKNKTKKKVANKAHFKSANLMFKKINFKKVTPDAVSAREASRRFLSYPGYDKKIKEFGIFAFYLK